MFCHSGSSPDSNFHHIDKVMHTHQFFTWKTHTAENTTLLDYKKLYTYMCNIVTEFYLYSIVYIYLINSRLDVTFSVRHHFRIANFINT